MTTVAIKRTYQQNTHVVNFRRRDKEEIERKFRRLNERFERLDTEKNETQKAIEQLKNEIHLLNT